MWSIKSGQEIRDAHSGLTLRFGEHTDDANTVFLTISFKEVGTNFIFKRDGEVLSMMPVHGLTDEQKAAVAESEDRVLGVRHEEGVPDDSPPTYPDVPPLPPELFQSNPHSGIDAPRPGDA